MNRYQRIVSYLYEYKHGVKGKNVGYIRVDCREGRFRMCMQLRGCDEHTPKIVEGFCQKNKVIFCCPFGEMKLQGNVANYRIDYEENKIGKYQIQLEDLEGIILYGNQNDYIAARWDNHDVMVMEKKEWEQKEDSLMPTQEKEWEQKEDSPVLMQEKEAVDPPVKDEHKEDVDKDSDSLEVETEEYSPIKDIPDSAPYQCNEIGENETCETRYEKNMMSVLPVIHPFGPDSKYHCVRMEPKDFGFLPMHCWHLANHPMVLCGFKQYRHLLFVKKQTGEYRIGIPGLYDMKWKNCAQKYQVEEFHPLCQHGPCNGGFGYWFMKLPNSCE